MTKISEKITLLGNIFATRNKYQVCLHHFTQECLCTYHAVTGPWWGPALPWCIVPPTYVGGNTIINLLLQNPDVISIILITSQVLDFWGNVRIHFMNHNTIDVLEFWNLTKTKTKTLRTIEWVSNTVDYFWQIEKKIMILRASDWQSERDLDSIRNSCDVWTNLHEILVLCLK